MRKFVSNWGALIGANISAWVLFALLAAPPPAEAQGELKEYPINISCTSTNTNTSIGFTAKKILIKNSINSANEVYITLVSGVATTASVPFEPGDGVALDNANILRFGCITAATETATVTGAAWR